MQNYPWSNFFQSNGFHQSFVPKENFDDLKDAYDQILT